MKSWVADPLPRHGYTAGHYGSASLSMSPGCGLELVAEPWKS